MIRTRYTCRGERALGRATSHPQILGRHLWKRKWTRSSGAQQNKDRWAKVSGEALVPEGGRKSQVRLGAAPGELNRRRLREELLLGREDEVLSSPRWHCRGSLHQADGGQLASKVGAPGGTLSSLCNRKGRPKLFSRWRCRTQRGGSSQACPKESEHPVSHPTHHCPVGGIVSTPRHSLGTLWLARGNAAVSVLPKSDSGLPLLCP